MQIDYATVIPSALASMSLDWPEIPTMVGWGSILSDLGAVHASANELATLIEQGHGNTLQSEGISWMIIVRYGRCYASAAGRRATLDEADIAKRLPNDLASLHRGLIERRNATFAHAGDQCQHGMHVHLLEIDNEPQLIASPVFSAPGPIVDPQQARLIADLTAAIQPIASHEILDMTLPTTVSVLYRKPENAGGILTKHPTDLTGGVAYHPMLVGAEFLWRIGAIQVGVDRASPGLSVVVLTT